MLAKYGRLYSVISCPNERALNAPYSRVTTELTQQLYFFNYSDASCLNSFKKVAIVTNIGLARKNP